MAKTKAAKKPAAEPASDCPFCRALKCAYPDQSYAVLRKHCGACGLRSPDAMTTDGLPPTTAEAKVSPEPPDEPPAKLVADWDGRVRQVWAKAGTVPSPESNAWEHLKEWADARRQEEPRLTVRGIVLLYRSCRPQNGEEGVCRLKKLFPAEWRAEGNIWKAEFSQKLPPPSMASPASGQSSPTAGTSGPNSPNAASMKSSTSSTNSPAASKSEHSSPKRSKSESTGGATPSSKSTPRSSSKDLDEWGYKIGTRAATINAYLTDEWMTTKEIEQGSGATSAGSHLSSLAAAGRVEYQKAPPGQSGGRYRRKA